MDSKYTLHNSVVLVIRLPTIIKFGGDLTKFWQKQVGSFLVHSVLMCHNSLYWTRWLFTRQP